MPQGWPRPPVRQPQQLSRLSLVHLSRAPVPSHDVEIAPRGFTIFRPGGWRVELLLCSAIDVSGAARQLRTLIVAVPLTNGDVKRPACWIPWYKLRSVSKKRNEMRRQCVKAVTRSYTASTSYRHRPSFPVSSMRTLFLCTSRAPGRECSSLETIGSYDTFKRRSAWPFARDGARLLGRGFGSSTTAILRTSNRASPAIRHGKDRLE